MRNFLTMMVIVFMTMTAKAIPLQRLFQDIKLPTQAQIEHYIWTAPTAIGSATLKLENAVGTGSPLVVSSFLAQPDVPRNIVLQTAGTGANVGAGTATVVGTNIYGKSISETFSVSGGASAALTGNSAFASVSSVTWPQASGANVRLSIGVGKKLGIARCMNHAGEYFSSEFGGVYDLTRGVMAIHVTQVENNTFAPNTTPDASSEIDLFYLQNFRCFPSN